MLIVVSNVARFLIPLAGALALLAVLSVPIAESLISRWISRDLDARAELVKEALEVSVAEALRAAGQPPDPSRLGAALRQVFERAVSDERLQGLALCAGDGQLLLATGTMARPFDCGGWLARAGAAGQRAERSGGPVHERVLRMGDPPPALAGATPGQVRTSTAAPAVLLVQHDFSFADRRLQTTRWSLIGLFGLFALLITAVTLIVAHLTWRGWAELLRDAVRGRRGHEPGDPPLDPAGPGQGRLRPLTQDLERLIQSLARERLEQPPGAMQWTPKSLRDLLEQQFPGDEVLVVSNREPYIHSYSPDGIVHRRPASGLVTAVEPVMRACSGTWVAHGSGEADREVVDEGDRVVVPPNAPPGTASYQLRRIWLTEQEEQGFYYGFANEGLWPLCHVAHVRPVFRDSDWAAYRAVNQRFADAVAAEAKTSDPIVLVQDYHFALVPAMVRELLPDATIISFWHIPWPNFESFGICPWKEDLLKGMLGSDILGFHTPYHCRNFVETVDRFLEVRIERESDLISMGGSLTHVHAYPISIAWPESMPVEQFPALRADLRRRYGLPEDHAVAIGVDRLDYTKGIGERIRAVERMLERFPQWIGRFTLIQIAAPSRSALAEYQRFEADVREVAEAVNRRFARGTIEPIRLLIEHHDNESVLEHYRAADVALVTSLHDGMNLVSKEFVAAHDDERGVLILSQFAGAARELLDALIVNPYHVDQIAEAIFQALEMPIAEQSLRMRSMRQIVKAFNVYRWAGRMLLDAGQLRRRVRLRQRIERSEVPSES